MYIYIYIYVYICVCICICIYVCMHHVFHFEFLRNGPTETASDSLKIDVTKKLISPDLKHISPSCKKHWKAYLLLL